jgi:hypothetical protein
MEQVPREAGVLAEHHGLADRACSAGFLRSILTSERFPIFRDLGPGSTTCHLDERAMLSATEAVQQDIAAGCDLVLLNKFGKLEASNSGLADAFRAAIEGDVPVLTPASESAWQAYATPPFVALPAAFVVERRHPVLAPSGKVVSRSLLPRASQLTCLERRP